MTKLSVNVNKIALLRNSRGNNYPHLIGFTKKLIDIGVKGITIHPRPDERHIKKRDARELSLLLKEYPIVELNIEGYPSEEFLCLIEETLPDQCTLVPDSEDQLTSDHGWDFNEHGNFVDDTAKRLNNLGIRTVAFVDPSVEQIQLASKTSLNRIELYTESFAGSCRTPEETKVFEKYSKCADCAQSLGLGVNAGHDLSLSNLARFLQIPNILEVSIGHAIVVESIEFGISNVINKYHKICGS
jgi:pyridoxine 5-phosphate synthase